MKTRVSVALLVGFGALLFLIALLGVGSLRRADEMHRQMISAHLSYEEVDRVIRDLPSDIHLVALLARDYVMDPSPTEAAAYREQLAGELEMIRRSVGQLRTAMPAQRDQFERLQRETTAWAAMIEPMLSWSPDEKRARSQRFLRDSVIPRRQSVVTLARELGALNAQIMESEKLEWRRAQADLRRFVKDLLLICLVIGLVVALISTWRVVKLERQKELERERAEEAEAEQRRLATRVVRAQEEERKRISLELHDAVGQMASALGMQLGRLETAHQASPAGFPALLAEAKQMNTDVVRAVRDLAAGLRPAVLDDLGLGPALRSHAREYFRRTGVPVEVRLDGEIEGVPEPHRTSIFRIVQEALNNCGRHSEARNIIVSLSAQSDAVSVAVRDDGAGFDPGQRSRTGLGLIGMEERARALGGRAKISSRPGHGTVVEVEIPIKETANA